MDDKEQHLPQEAAKKREKPSDVHEPDPPDDAVANAEDQAKDYISATPG